MFSGVLNDNTKGQLIGIYLQTIETLMMDKHPGVCHSCVRSPFSTFSEIPPCHSCTSVMP